MEEQLISFETAKLAKEKGFILSHPLYLYDKNGEILNLKKSFDLARQTFLLDNTTILASTQSLLQKWLREVHKINIESNYLPNVEKYGCLYIPMSGKTKLSDLKYVDKRRFDNYEEALELGLQEALKLINN